VRGLFDTLVAAQLAGEEKIGLADLLARHCGVTLDKRFQRADWSLRPLSDGMVEYAVEDTRHLARLAAILERELEERGRIEWAREDCLRLEEVQAAGPRTGPLFTRVKGAAALDPRALAILEELLAWREGEAERRDVPPFRVLGNESLLEVARNAPADAAALAGVRELPHRMADRYGRALLAAVSRGVAVPEERLAAYPRPERGTRDREVEARLDRLKAWRTVESARLGIAPGILINNDLLGEIARTVPRLPEELLGLGSMKGWQRRELGPGILAALAAPPQENAVPAPRPGAPPALGGDDQSP
jgi:ribonuclease D